MVFSCPRGGFRRAPPRPGARKEDGRVVVAVAAAWIGRYTKRSGVVPVRPPPPRSALYLVRVEGLLLLGYSGGKGMYGTSYVPT